MSRDVRMKITLITGGARSGKTRYALEEAARMGAEPGTYLATARGEDEEMARRISIHRRDRPPSWETVEAPLDAATALTSARHSLVILDCLTLLLSNHVLMDEPGGVSPGGGAGQGTGAMDLSEAAVEERASRAVEGLMDAARRRSGRLVVITNEVGMGVVPAHPLGRWFRDAHGRANQRVAEAADRVVLMVSGVPLVVR